MKIPNWDEVQHKSEAEQNPIDRLISEQTPAGDAAEREFYALVQDAIDFAVNQRVAEIRESLKKIVIVEGEDKGVVLLSQEGPTKYDPTLKCQVYLHLYFSELGDALIALHEKCGVECPETS